MEKELELIYKAILEGDLDTTKDQVNQAIAAKIPAEIILKSALISAMGEVGRLFEQGEYFVPEMLVAARAMKGGLAILRPLLVEADIQPLGKIVIGTVGGDLHDIGKNLVMMMLEGAGFEIKDLGVDVKPDKFVAAVKEYQPDIVGLSALLTTTMPNMKATVLALKEAGLRDKVKVIVGGAPVTDTYARDIGADGYAPDAGQAATLAKNLIS
jgi:5-methyltetrahydrofolate--homocysteine methyltransferase